MALKTYSITVDTQLQMEAMEFLIKSNVVRGRNLTDAVTDYAVEFYNTERLRKDFTLVTELELLDKAKEEGLSTGKSSVVQYRRKGVLRDDNGPWYFQNKQHKVVYNLEKMLEFLKDRKESPKSRISKTKQIIELKEKMASSE